MNAAPTTSKAFCEYIYAFVSDVDYPLTIPLSRPNTGWISQNSNSSANNAILTYQITEHTTIMSLTFVQASPLVMLAGTVGILGYGTFCVSNKGSQHQQLSWKFPAFFSAWFWGFSIYTVAEEGILGFWPNHNSNLWGNQVFYDLLHSVALFWFALLPRARAVRMPILPWFMYVCSTASIGGLHMYARILYLEQKQEEEGNAAAFGTTGTTALYGANMTNEGAKEKVSQDRY